MTLCGNENLTASCVDRVSALTFAMRGLDYPCTVQVVWIKVWKAWRQDGSTVALDVTPTQCWAGEKESEGKKKERWRNQIRQFPVKLYSFCLQVSKNGDAFQGCIKKKTESCLLIFKSTQKSILSSNIKVFTDEGKHQSVGSLRNI